MMRLRRDRHAARLEMLPLMDVVFLLLVFFIYSMLIMTVNRGLPLELPVSSTARIESASSLSLSVRADGALFLDAEEVERADLSEKLRRKAEEDQDGLFLRIYAEDTLSYQDLFSVLDLVRQSGVARISLQARQTKTP
ncbi:MAG: biopolymer transporter ExbD [Desulfovibrio sp.]|jgi:biopolymer transport protein ExbD|nr:biopolymer transporter ExbD [Desulfovibrio sp.]